MLFIVEGPFLLLESTAVLIRAKRYPCPHCGEAVVQTANLSGPNFCPSCRKLFLVPAREKMPTWIWGALAVMVVYLQMGM